MRSSRTSVSKNEQSVLVLGEVKAGPHLLRLPQCSDKLLNPKHTWSNQAGEAGKGRKKYEET